MDRTEHQRAELQSAWEALLEAAKATTMLGRPEDPVELVDEYRHRAAVLSTVLDGFVGSRPAEPTLVRLFNTDDRSERKFLGDNADTRYFYANISADHDYVIRGRRGDEVYLSFCVHGGDPVDQLQQRIQSNLNHHDLVTADDGSFEISLSVREQPGNWLRLAEGAACLLSREYYVDRDRDRWAFYEIERVDTNTDANTDTNTNSGPDARIDAIIDGLQHAARFLDVAPNAIMGPRRRPANTLSPPFRVGTDLPGWGTPDNTYCGIPYELDDDQALVIDGEMVECDYWNVQLWNVQMQSIGVGRHKASINHAEAGLRAGDPFRVVVSRLDPGVRPWLETQGHRRGTAYVRWLCASRTPPTPTLRIVPVSEVCTLDGPHA